GWPPPRDRGLAGAPPASRPHRGTSGRAPVVRPAGHHRPRRLAGAARSRDARRPRGGRPLGARAGVVGRAARGGGPGLTRDRRTGGTTDETSRLTLSELRAP